MEYNFRLPKVGRVAHLVTSLRAAAGISKDTRVQVATVYGGKFNKLRGSTRCVAQAGRCGLWVCGTWCGARCGVCSLCIGALLALSHDVLLGAAWLARTTQTPGLRLAVRASHSLLQMCRSHLFAFCLPNGTVGTLPIYHRRITRTVYPPLNEGEEPRVHLYAQTTGLPFLLPVTQDTTVHHVHAAALAWAAACHDGVFSGAHCARAWAGPAWVSAARVLVRCITRVRCLCLGQSWGTRPWCAARTPTHRRAAIVTRGAGYVLWVGGECPALACR